MTGGRKIELSPNGQTGMHEMTGRGRRRSVETDSVVDPHLFQCGSGSRSREPNQCGSESWPNFQVIKFNFYMENIDT